MKARNVVVYSAETMRCIRRSRTKHISWLGDSGATDSDADLAQQLEKFVRDTHALLADGSGRLPVCRDLRRLAGSSVNCRHFPSVRFSSAPTVKHNGSWLAWMGNAVVSSFEVGGQEEQWAFIMLHPTEKVARWCNGKAFGLAISRSCLLYTSPSPRDRQKSRMPSSA